jgi:hypothetical protein
VKLPIAQLILEMNVGDGRCAFFCRPPGSWSPGGEEQTGRGTRTDEFVLATSPTQRLLNGHRIRFVVWPAESFAWRWRSTRATLVDSLARLFKNGSKDVAILGSGEQAPLRSEFSDSFVK